MSYRIRASVHQLAHMLRALHVDQTVDIILTTQTLAQVVDHMPPVVDADGFALGQLLSMVLQEQPGEHIVHSLVL